MKQFIMLAVAAAVMCLTPAFAEDAQNTNMQILIDKVKADKKLLIASNMELTDQESKDFWPLYEGYQKKLEEINSHMGGIINEYAEAYNKGSVPDAVAKKIINEALKTEGAEVIMRREYAEKLSLLQERHAVFFGKASSCENPVMIRLNDRDKFIEAFREEHPPPDLTVTLSDENNNNGE